MEIRKATKDDEEQIASLLFELMNVKDIGEAKKTFVKEINREDVYIVAEEDGKLLGLVTWLMHGRYKHGLAELNHIVVSPEARGKGVASKLFKAMVEDIKETYEKNNSKLRKLFLLTRHSNKNAQEFYKKLGFEHEATLKSHFYDKEEEYMLSMFF